MAASVRIYLRLPLYSQMEISQTQKLVICEIILQNHEEPFKNLLMLNIHTNFQALTSADGTQSSPLKVLWNVKCSVYQ